MLESGKTMEQRLLNEIAHGQKIAHISGDVWGWKTPAGKLRWQRRVGMLAGEITPDMTVLEVGCGTGSLTKELQKTQARILALDISPDLLDVARTERASKGITFLLGNAYNLGCKDSSVDRIIGSSVLHHLEVDTALTEFYRVLKPQGAIVFTEPNMMNPQIAIQKNVSCIKKWLGDSPDETAFFRWPLKRKLRHTGFHDIVITPFDFLHPSIPRRFIPFFQRAGHILDSMPVLSEIAGSLFIYARK
jgi:2-polyprenyl-3-methyl-5-hydroxy-6-metoxy-1,4-benzoquinol methylase